MRPKLRDAVGGHNRMKLRAVMGLQRSESFVREDDVLLDLRDAPATTIPNRNFKRIERKLFEDRYASTRKCVHAPRPVAVRQRAHGGDRRPGVPVQAQRLRDLEDALRTDHLGKPGSRDLKKRTARCMYLGWKRRR